MDESIVYSFEPLTWNAKISIPVRYNPDLVVQLRDEPDVEGGEVCLGEDMVAQQSRHQAGQTEGNKSAPVHCFFYILKMLSGYPRTLSERTNKILT